MKKQTSLIEFVIRKNFKVNLRGNFFLTPFEELSMYLAVNILPIQVEDYGSMHRFKFNCMDYTGCDNFHIIKHLSGISQGYYRVVSSRMKAAFTNSRDYPFQ